MAINGGDKSCRIIILVTPFFPLTLEYRSMGIMHKTRFNLVINNRLNMDSRLLRWKVSLGSGPGVYSQKQDWISVMGSSQLFRLKNVGKSAIWNQVWLDRF